MMAGRWLLTCFFLAVVLISNGQAVECLSSSNTSPTRVVIVGGGPCGLFLAAQLLNQTQTSNSHKYFQVHILERLPRQKKAGNAFGMGLSPRIVKTLESLDPRLAENVLSVGQAADGVIKNDKKRQKKYPGFVFKIAQRQDICDQMMQYLQDTYPNELETGQWQVSYDEGCESVDFSKKTVKTSQGRTLEYDLLIGSDGINSNVRQQLARYLEEQEDASSSLNVQHYLNTKRFWKALELPPQPYIPPGTFKRYTHPSFFFQLLPRYPKGHIALVFFPADSGNPNPEGITTAADLKQAMTDVLQGTATTKKKRGMFDPVAGFRRLIGILPSSNENNPDDPSHREVILDDQALESFVQARPGRSHVMKIDRYHDTDASVALIGDAAHGMYSILGQGCACGLQNTKRLGDALLLDGNDLDTALRQYSEQAVPEGHAVTDLNLIAHAFEAPIKSKLRFLPSMLFNSLRGKSLLQTVGQHDIPFTQLLKENKVIVREATKQWEKDRVPFLVASSSVSSRPPTDASKVRKGA